MKRCSRCELFKPLEEFCTSKNRKATADGYSQWCRQCMKEYHAIWYQKNKVRVDKSNKLWRKLNPEKALVIERRYAKKYPDRRRKSYRNWEFKTYHTDLKYRLNQILSSNIRRSLGKNKNGYSWESLVGYTLDELKKHLEVQFKAGMSWDNYGKWQIDHIRPVSSFNFQTPTDKDFRTCWSLTNLQPLWAKDNLEKRAKII